jgi:hypothetical protein
LRENNLHNPYANIQKLNLTTNNIMLIFVN